MKTEDNLDLYRLNATAETAASRITNPTTLDAYTIEKNPLPTKPLAFASRIELYVYLKKLNAERLDLINKKCGGWQDERTKMDNKIKEINQLLDEAEGNKAPITELDYKLQCKKIIANNRLSLCLPEFIKLLPADPNTDNTSFPAFYRLVEDYGLIVHDKVVDGQIVSSSELLSTLRQRQQQAWDSFDDYEFCFWDGLSNEIRYTVERDDVATAYDKAGKAEFPWLSIEDNQVSLNVAEHTKIVVVGIDDNIKANNERVLTLSNKKPRKKLISKIRDTSESLLLIYEIADYYKIEYLDQLPSPKAWGKITSREFESELIKEIGDTKVSITLTDGKKLLRTNFLEQYRNRFK
jgi:hypothetical protein